ncbi:regulation of nuclear pre-mrna domain-containing protein 1a-like [Dermatophagoides farinae]|uniref:Regulation of nuclear pre-mrna domain-containing protein 1a-like n=1 Tax=Dermatophagoides farinae TaxID=6954 RepID=A0A9D4P093_DERFA|nr:regulation of nuclear pre-mRNA domain-containing protein 1B-like [Dermatophagoides farinae]KAH7642386.1 regulation of nuclear pre-mrna domain-containing protein 1a-like [Dermatophagoides farinae]
MSGFTQQAFEKKLSELNSSQQSIQTVSLWLIHHRKHYKSIVQTWFQGLKKAKPARKLTYMYLANDVIQNSRKKGPEFSKEFLNVLLKAFEHISNEIEASTLASLDRLLKIWEERNIYEKNHITSFKQALHNKTLTSKSNSDITVIVPDNGTTNNNNNSNNSTNNNNINAKSSLKRDIEESSSHGNGHISSSNKKFSPDFQLDADVMNNMMTKLGSKIAAEYPVDMNKYENVEPDKLIKILKELENCASADEDVRQKISNMPSELFDVKLFEKVITNGPTENWVKLVNEAQNILTSYNTRLAKELEGRKQLSTMLVYFIEGQRRALTQAEQSLKQYRDKLRKVISVREELQSHLQNLPDLSRLPSVSPLPSAVDLFKKEKPD